MAEHVPGIWETEVAADGRRLDGLERLMGLEMSLVDVPAAALLATAAAQPHDRGRAVVRRAEVAEIWSRSSGMVGFFIEPELQALGVGGLAGL